MRKLLNIFFVRELKNFLWVYLISIILFTTLNVMFSSEEAVIQLVYSLCLILPVMIPFFWKVTFSRNLNWILLLPISKKKIFWAHFFNNGLVFVLTSVAVFLLLKLHPFFSIINRDGKWDAFDYILRSPQIFWDMLMKEPISGWLILIMFLVLTIVFTTFFGIYGTGHHRTSSTEKNIKKARKSYKNYIKSAVKIFVVVTALFLLRHYLFNPFIFLAGSGFVIMFFTVERTTHYLKTPVNLRRKFIKIAALVPICIIMISFMLSLHNVKKGDGKLASDGISMMRNLSFTLNQERIIEILQTDVSAASIYTISKLEYYKKHKESIQTKVNYQKMIKNKKSFQQLKAITSLFDVKNMTSENIRAFLKQVDAKNYKAVRYLYFKILDRGFTAKEVNGYLKKKQPAFKVFGILLAKHFHDSDTVRLLKKIKKAPFDSNYYLRETLSYLMGYRVTDEKLYRFLHENGILSERRYNCNKGNIDVSKNLDKASYCFIKTMDAGNIKHMSILRKCSWFLEGNTSCMKKLDEYYRQ